MEFPIVHTNFLDAVLAVPVVLVLTQIAKIVCPIPRHYVPMLAVLFGLIISIFYSHRGNLWAGVFMGYFYGYAAIGNYSSLRTAVRHLRNDSKTGHPF